MPAPEAAPIFAQSAWRNRDLLDAGRAFLDRHAPNGEVLVLASVKLAADELARECARPALAGVHRHTLRDLAFELAADRLLAEGWAPVTRLGREALAARVADEAARQGWLRYFGPVAAMGGFAAALARTLHDLRLDAVAEDTLAGCGDRGADLAVLLRLYRQELTGHKLADRASRFQLALDAIAEGKHPAVGIPLLLFCIEPQHTLERRLIEALAERAPAVLQLSSADRAAEACGPQPETPLQFLQRDAFSEARPPRSESIAAADGLTILAASGEALECVEIARRISALAVEGMRFDEMAVLLRSPERYGAHLREALGRAGIPAYFTRTANLPDPSGRALLVLLECAEKGLHAADFAEYLSLGQTPSNVRAPMRWEKLIVEAHTGGSPERWRANLAALGQMLFEKRVAADDVARERLDRDLDALESLRGFAAPLIERLAALPHQATWGDWLDALNDLAEAALRRPAGVQAALEELSPMAAIGPVTLAGVLRVLSGRLRFLRDDDPSQRYGSVFVGGIPDAAGMSFRAVFVPGLNEGTFPVRWNQDPLLPDELRNALGIDAAPGDTGLFRSAVACADTHLFLSYSGIDLLTGRPRVPSFYVFEAWEAAYGVPPDVAGLQKETRGRVKTRAGWPAPDEPADAIDDAEFDLALLSPEMHGAAPAAGTAAYLSEVNPHLVRALRTRWKRWSKKWRDADGLVELDIEALLALDPYRLRKRAYSPTALEHLAACPYRFALRSIYGLRPAEHGAEPQRMDPDVRGRLFHAVQTEFLRELQAAGELPLKGVTAALEQRLNAVLDRISAALADRLSPALPGVWAAERERLRIDLAGWLRQMVAEPGWTPLHMEWAFGLPDPAGRDPASRTESVEILEGFRLAGSVDLIERHSSGLMRPVDFKTGAPPQPAPECIGKGEVLQPLLYSLAIEQAFGQKTLCGRLSYATLRQNYRTIDIPLNEIARSRARLVLTAIDGMLERGFLPAAPRDKACEECDYGDVCGPYEEERTRRKPRPDLQELLDIRRTK